MGLVALAMVGCGKRDAAVVETPYKVSKGDVNITIIESGTVDSIKTV